MDGGLSPPRVARRLGVSERTVRRWVMRALGEQSGNTLLMRSEVAVNAAGRYFVRRSAVRRLEPAFGSSLCGG